jgi:ABC-type lipoprotein export system ATPase subunit
VTDRNDYITRKLTWIDEQQKLQVIADIQVVNKFNQPLVILGDSGMGKTRLMEQLARISHHLIV